MPKKKGLEYFAEVAEFRFSLNRETDRGCALMAAAYLSNQLERLLRKTLVDNRKIIDELFGILGPLGSFSAKIEVAYSMGLLPKVARQDLHVLRKIRNEFAHEAGSLTFLDRRVASRCDNLQHHWQECGAKARAKFISTAIGVCAVIHAAIARTDHATEPVGLVFSKELKSQIRKSAEELLEAIPKGKTRRPE